jgi:hypothetical protein
VVSAAADFVDLLPSADREGQSLAHSAVPPKLRYQSTARLAATEPQSKSLEPGSTTDAPSPQTPRRNFAKKSDLRYPFFPPTAHSSVKAVVKRPPQEKTS